MTDLQCHKDYICLHHTSYIYEEKWCLLCIFIEIAGNIRCHGTRYFHAYIHLGYTSLTQSSRNCMSLLLLSRNTNTLSHFIYIYIYIYIYINKGYAWLSVENCFYPGVMYTERCNTKHACMKTSAGCNRGSGFINFCLSNRQNNQLIYRVPISPNLFA